MQQAVVLVTSSPTTVAVGSAQSYLLQLLQAYKIKYVEVDCSEPANRELREAAWAISGKRVVYPQLFARAGEGGALRFLGDWATISAWSESNADLHELDKCLEGLERV
jgi:hypothetical protein